MHRDVNAQGAVTECQKRYFFGVWPDLASFAEKVIFDPYSTPAVYEKGGYAQPPL